MSTAESRPPLTAGLTAAEFLRWYWLRTELAAFARGLGLRSGGAKAELTELIAARLAGTTTSAPVVGRRRRPEPLPEPLTAATTIPGSQPSTQQIRRWLLATVGPTFRFDGAMRAFFAADGSRTLGDAAEHWHRTRKQPGRTIDPQFELNRFTRQWHLDHLGRSQSELLTDWAAYRARPVDQRGRA